MVAGGCSAGANARTEGVVEEVVSRVGSLGVAHRVDAKERLVELLPTRGGVLELG